MCAEQGDDSSAASDTAALARRLFHKSFKLLSNQTNIPPHKGSVTSQTQEKAFKENTFPELFIYSSVLPHTNLMPFIRWKSADIQDFGTLTVLFAVREDKGEA